MRVRVSIIVWGLAVAGCLGSSCAQIPAAQGAESPVADVRDLLTGLESLRNNSQYREEVLKHVGNSEEFAAAWAELTSRLQPPPQAPAVDFGRERVVIYSPGQQKTGGHRLQLKPVRGQAGWLIEHLLPGRGCITTSQMTSPLLVLAVPFAIPTDQIRIITRKVDCP